MTDVRQIDDGVHCIDLRFQGQHGVIAAYLLEDAGERALIETGPTSTIETLLQGLRSIDVDPASIGKLLVTHIHLDHAGASGTWMRRFPDAQLFVHDAGAPHMVAPSRLLQSAARIYGSMMDELWGHVEPVPADRVTTVGDGDIVTVGNADLRVLYTPGHASHHVVYFHGERGSVFAGDVAAVRLQGFRYVRPPTPPPDVDLELWDRSLERIRALHPSALYLAHFGPFTDVGWHLMQAQQTLHAWAEIVRTAMESGQEGPEIVDNLRLHADHDLLRVTHDAEPLVRYELATPYGMSVDGYLRYFRKLGRREQQEQTG